MIPAPSESNSDFLLRAILTALNAEVWLRAQRADAQKKRQDVPRGTFCACNDLQTL